MTSGFDGLALLPPIVAVAVALATRRVVIALFGSVCLGALLLAWDQPLRAPSRVAEILWATLSDPGHQWILAFALLLGGMMKALRERASAARLGARATGFVSSRRRGQLAAWLLGLVFFFDDYANTLIVGSTVGPAARRERVSGEKLAFIVDATAAPVASLAPLSSWIAVELGYIADQIAALEIQADAYSLFLSTIPHRFYSVLMLWFGLVVALTGRDFGPMARAESRALEHAAREVPSLSTPSAKLSPLRSIIAGGPVVASLLGLAFALYWTGQLGARAAGESISIRSILSHASGSKSLAAGALLGVLAMLATASSGGGVELKRAARALIAGFKEMREVILVLTLAWALGAVCRDLHTAAYVVSLLGHGFPAPLVPTAVFVIAGLVSFATGTSWGTMGIVFPLAVPLIHELAPGAEGLLTGTIAAVLSGAVFGDHCSPISDTTIMSALAAECDQVEHVRTQLPYALTVATVGIVFGSLPVAFGVYGPASALLVAGAVLVLIVRGLGVQPECLG